MRLDLYHVLFAGLSVKVAAPPPVFDALDQGNDPKRDGAVEPHPKRRKERAV